MELPATRAIAPEMSGVRRRLGTRVCRVFLVIDDDPVQRMTISKVGAKAGYRTIAVATVEEAMREVRQHKFDCVTLDLLLDGQNGILMLNEIADFNPGVLLIVVSGRKSGGARIHTRHRNRPAPRCAELPKPLDLASLRILLTNRLTAACAS